MCPNTGLRYLSFVTVDREFSVDHIGAFEHASEQAEQCGKFGFNSELAKGS